jgi:hypothetical protein
VAKIPTYSAACPKTQTSDLAFGPAPRCQVCSVLDPAGAAARAGVASAPRFVALAEQEAERQPVVFQMCAGDRCLDLRRLAAQISRGAAVASAAAVAALRHVLVASCFDWFGPEE